MNSSMRQVEITSISRAWGTLSLGILLSILLIARIPKRDIVLITSVGGIRIFLCTRGLRALLLLTVSLCVHLREVWVIVLLIVTATLSTCWPVVFLLLQSYQLHISKGGIEHIPLHGLFP